MSASRFDTVRHGGVPRAGWIVAPAVLAAVGVSGVTAKPLVGRHAARKELALASERAELREHEREEARRFDEHGGMARLAAAVEGAASVLPERVSPVDAAALCGLIARRRGFDLANVVVGAPQETELAQLDDRVVRIDVDARGVASLSELVTLAPDLRAAGYPCDVLDLTLTRKDGAERRFDFRIAIGLYQRAPRLEPTASEDSGEGGEGEAE